MLLCGRKLLLYTWYTGDEFRDGRLLQGPLLVCFLLASGNALLNIYYENESGLYRHTAPHLSARWIA